MSFLCVFFIYWVYTMAAVFKYTQVVHLNILRVNPSISLSVLYYIIGQQLWLSINSKAISSQKMKII